MGRMVYDQNGDFIWKYTFAKQGSEQYRIAEELKIGTRKEDEDESGDVLSLSKKDLAKLTIVMLPKRKAIAKFFKAERNTFKKEVGSQFKTASMENMDKLYGEAQKYLPDTCFWIMCHHYLKHGLKFFRHYPKVRLMKCYGEY